MTDNNWDMYSEEMEEDLIMDEGAEDEDMEISSGGEKTIYPEDYSRDQIISPRFGQTSSPRFDLHSISPVHGFGEVIDEKGESLALLQMEKTIVHQNFVDNFEDDFDDEDYV